MIQGLPPASGRADVHIQIMFDLILAREIIKVFGTQRQIQFGIIFIHRIAGNNSFKIYIFRHSLIISSTVHPESTFFAAFFTAASASLTV